MEPVLAIPLLQAGGHGSRRIPVRQSTPKNCGGVEPQLVQLPLHSVLALTQVIDGSKQADSLPHVRRLLSLIDPEPFFNITANFTDFKPVGNQQCVDKLPAAGNDR